MIVRLAARFRALVAALSIALFFALFSYARSRYESPSVGLLRLVDFSFCSWFSRP